MKTTGLSGQFEISEQTASDLAEAMRKYTESSKEIAFNNEEFNKAIVSAFDSLCTAEITKIGKKFDYYITMSLNASLLTRWFWKKRADKTKYKLMRLIKTLILAKTEIPDISIEDFNK